MWVATHDWARLAQRRGGQGDVHQLTLSSVGKKGNGDSCECFLCALRELEDAGVVSDSAGDVSGVNTR